MFKYKKISLELRLIFQLQFSEVPRDIGHTNLPPMLQLTRKHGDS